MLEVKPACQPGPTITRSGRNRLDDEKVTSLVSQNKREILARKLVSKMTCNMSSGMLNPAITN